MAPFVGMTILSLKTPKAGDKHTNHFHPLPLIISSILLYKHWRFFCTSMDLQASGSLLLRAQDGSARTSVFPILAVRCMACVGGRLGRIRLPQKPNIFNFENSKSTETRPPKSSQSQNRKGSGKSGLPGATAWSFTHGGQGHRASARARSGILVSPDVRALSFFGPEVGCSRSSFFSCVLPFGGVSFLFFFMVL